MLMLMDIRSSSRMAAQSSALYATKYHMIDDLTPKDGKIDINMKDDVIRGHCNT